MPVHENPKSILAVIWLPKASQYYVNYDVNGVDVGMSTVEKQADSDGMECIGRGPWQHYVLITCGSHRVPEWFAWNCGWSQNSGEIALIDMNPSSTT